MAKNGRDEASWALSAIARNRRSSTVGQECPPRGLTQSLQAGNAEESMVVYRPALSEVTPSTTDLAYTRALAGIAVRLAVQIAERLPG
jgi:hypothetical protein